MTNREIREYLEINGCFTCQAEEPEKNWYLYSNDKTAVCPNCRTKTSYEELKARI
jgi:hypothetical protein